MNKKKFKKEKCDVPVDIVDLERRADYFLYYYMLDDCTRVVLSESVDDKDIIRVCNEVIDAIIDFKRDLDGSKKSS